MGQDKVSGKVSKTSLTRRTVLSGAAAMGLSTMARAQAPAEVKVGLIVPLSGIYTRPGQVMKMGAEMGIEHINAQGGIKSLGGAKMKLVLIDCGDTTEKAKNAAQRMVAQETDLVAATGAYLSSFTLAVTEVTERARNSRSWLTSTTSASRSLSSSWPACGGTIASPASSALVCCSARACSNRSM